MNLTSCFKYYGLVSLSEFFMKVVFGKWPDSAVLLAPPIQFNGAVCLQFQYRLSHPKIILSINTASHSNSSSIQELMKLKYSCQVNTSDWNAANVTLKSSDGQEQQVVFVAEKIGFTLDLEYAAIRDIVMTNSPCPGNNTSKS